VTPEHRTWFSKIVLAKVRARKRSLSDDEYMTLLSVLWSHLQEGVYEAAQAYRRRHPNAL